VNQVRTGRVIFVVVADCRRAIVVILLPFRDMPELDFAEIIDLICKEDSRFAKKAYDFVRQGLDHTVKELRKKQGKEVDRSFHVTGPQLLEGMRIYSLDQYGPMTKTVLNSWGVKRCRDFGAIVFNLIEYNIFSKTANDKQEDFSDIYTFDEAFVKPFLSRNSRPVKTTARKSPKAA